VDRQHDRLDRHIWLLSSVITVGLLMTIVDTTVVVVAIETLTRSFHANLSSVQWVTTGYLLALALVIPLSRWAVGRFGSKTVWMSAAGVFLAGSALCGAAWSIRALIVFRVVQGIGGGLLQPVGQSVLARAAGPRRMGRVMSINAVPIVLGPILGPVLGGSLIEYASWRWVFYLNLPIGAVALLLAWKLLPSDPDHRPVPLDVRGLLLLSPGFALLAYGFSQAGSQGFGGRTTLGCITVGLVLIGVFVPHARRLGRDALVDVSLFASRSFNGSALVNLLTQLANFGTVVTIPLYYQLVRGEGATRAGLMLTAQALGLAFAMPISGRLTDRIGSRRLIPVGVTLMLVGTIPFTEIGPGTSLTLLAGAQVVRGLGLAFMVLPSNAAAMSSVPRDEIRNASTALSVIQRLGASLGASLAVVWLERQIKGVVPAGHGGALSSIAAMPAASRAHISGALATGFAHTFWLTAILTAMSAAPVLLMKRGRATGHEDDIPAAVEVTAVP
jgi:EmrB/QacA subfamily drug resistance transporter